jgi:L-aspartate oxidase
LVTSAALWREESRGGHFRTDYPEQRDDFHVHSIQRLNEAISGAKQISFDNARAA